MVRDSGKKAIWHRCEGDSGHLYEAPLIKGPFWQWRGAWMEARNTEAAVIQLIVVKHWPVVRDCLLHSAPESETLLVYHIHLPFFWDHKLCAIRISSISASVSWLPNSWRFGLSLWDWQRLGFRWSQDPFDAFFIASTRRNSINAGSFQTPLFPTFYLLYTIQNTQASYRQQNSVHNITLQ